MYNNTIPFPNMMPFNMMPNNYDTNNELNNKINILEKQIKRLDERITRLEAIINTNNNTKLEDNNSMYMM